jgi:hypothetical protein
MLQLPSAYRQPDIDCLTNDEESGCGTDTECEAAN